MLAHDHHRPNLDNEVVLFPRLAFVEGIPNIGRLDHLASLYGFCCKGQRGAEGGLVHGAVKWFSKGITERHVIVKDPRCAALLQYIHRCPNHDRHDPAFFECSSRQTNGLMADGSQRNQNGNIHLILSARIRNSGRVLIDGQSLAIFCWNKVEPRGDIPNDTLLFE